MSEIRTHREMGVSYVVSGANTLNPLNYLLEAAGQHPVNATDEQINLVRRVGRVFQNFGNQSQCFSALGNPYTLIYEQCYAALPEAAKKELEENGAIRIAAASLIANDSSLQEKFSSFDNRRMHIFFTTPKYFSKIDIDKMRTKRDDSVNEFPLRSHFPNEYGNIGMMSALVKLYARILSSVSASEIGVIPPFPISSRALITAIFYDLVLLRNNTENSRR